MRFLKTYTDLSGCVVWFDSLGGLTVSGTDLTDWADQSGAGIASPATLANVIADNVATAVAPTYTASDALFGGKPSIVWGTGNAQTALQTPQFAADLAAPFTFLMCGKFDGTPNTSVNGRSIWAGAPSTIPSTRRIQITNPSTSAVSLGAFQNGLFIANGEGSTPLASQAFDATAPFVFAFATNANGDTRGVITNRTVIKRYRNTNTLRTHSGFRLGRGAQNTTVTDGQWIGRFSALVVYNRFLTEQESMLAVELMAARQGVMLPMRRKAVA